MQLLAEALAEDVGRLEVRHRLVEDRDDVQLVVLLDPLLIHELLRRRDSHDDVVWVLRLLLDGHDAPVVDEQLPDEVVRPVAELSGVEEGAGVRAELGTLGENVSKYVNCLYVVQLLEVPRLDPDLRAGLLGLVVRKRHSLRLESVPRDEANRVVDVAYIDNLYSISERRPNDVILMAGGMGKRLRPLTEDLPKPMLKVGEKPILETIISRFVDQGFQSFKISLNYHANTIRDYFGDGKRFDAEIEYLEETNAFGTAGAGSLLKEPPEAPVIVMNGDVLTQVDFVSLVTYHEEHDAVATMALREFGIQIPFGVVDVDNHWVTAINEKPSKQFLINAGIYVLSPAVVGLVPADQPSDMTDLFQTLIDTDQNVAAFPIHEYWMDIGHKIDLEKAKDEFKGIFG